MKCPLVVHFQVPDNRYLFKKPNVTIREVSDMFDCTKKTASGLINEFIKAGILVETTGHKRNQVC